MLVDIFPKEKFKTSGLVEKMIHIARTVLLYFIYIKRKKKRERGMEEFTLFILDKSFSSLSWRETFAVLKLKKVWCLKTEDCRKGCVFIFLWSRKLHNFKEKVDENTCSHTYYSSRILKEGIGNIFIQKINFFFYK